MSKFIFIEEYSPLSEDPISLMLEKIRGEKERGIIIKSCNTEDVSISSARMGGSSGLKSLAHTVDNYNKINVGTVGHIDHGVDHLFIDTPMKHDWFNELNLTPDTADEIKRLSICLTGHEFMFDSLTDLVLDTDSPECLGNFKKVTKGNRHTYPHWFKGKY